MALSVYASPSQRRSLDTPVWVDVDGDLVLEVLAGQHQLVTPFATLSSLSAKFRSLVESNP